MIQISVPPGEMVPDGAMHKGRQIPTDINEHNKSKHTQGTEANCTDHSNIEEATDDYTGSAELGHDNDITDRKHVAKVSIHSPNNIFVYMKSPSGQAPCVCGHCDYKTVICSWIT